MSVKKPIAWILLVATLCVLVATLCVLVAMRFRAMERREQQLAHQVQVYRERHQRACSLLRTRFQDAAVEAKLRHRAAGFDYLLVSGTFAEVFIFADTCVTLPPATQVAGELLVSGRLDPERLVAGVRALDAAFNAAEAAEWPL